MRLIRAKSLAVVAGVMIMSACAAIPSSGPVTKVKDDGGFGESTVRYSPARPVPGASPEQIVHGYLDAMLAFPVSSRTASAFLTPTAARSWSSVSGVRVYSDPEVARVRGTADVRLGFTENARLDRQGHYTPRDDSSAINYTLEQVDGQWRIANPQAGLLVNSKFFADYFRTFNLFYFDRPGQRLRPDPIHVVVGDQLATSLISSLGGGPLPADKGATRTYVPQLRALRLSVPVSDQGVADVEFTEDLGDLSRTVRDHLSAQIVWTLRQVPDVTAVQIIGGATPLTANGRDIQPIEAWAGYGPSTTRNQAYAIVRDKIVQIDGDRTQALSGGWGKNARGAQFVAVSDAGVAAVLSGRARVRLTDRSGKAPRTIAGDDFIAPQWDLDGTLWLMDTSATGTRLRVVDGKKPRQVEAKGLRSLDVATFSLAPDGTRYAVTTARRAGGALYVGPVLRDAKDHLLGFGRPTRIHSSVERPRSASWSSGTELTFLGQTEAGMQVHRVTIDGSLMSSGASRGGALLPDVDADTLAIGSGEAPALYVTDARDRLWFLPAEGSWRLVKTGKGGKVTGLTFGP